MNLGLPAEWLRYSTAKDLIDELKVGNPTLCPLASEMTDFPVNKTRGRFGGSFVVKELVYAYAMWVSPKFHLEVIRSYDRLATEGVAVHYTAAESVLEDPLSYMEKVIAQAKVLLNVDEHPERFYRVDELTDPSRFSLDNACGIPDLQALGSEMARHQASVIERRFLDEEAEPFIPCHPLSENP